MNAQEVIQALHYETFQNDYQAAMHAQMEAKFWKLQIYL